MNQTLEINKKLYFLHIPRVGGMAITHMVNATLDTNNIARYPSKFFVNNLNLEQPLNFNNYLFIQRHLGTYPIGKAKNLDVACLFRDPLERIVSNFHLAWNKFIIGNPKYEIFDEIEDKLKYYLIDDEQHKLQNNLQTRYICNSIEECVAQIRFNETPMLKKYTDDFNLIDKSTHSWHILNNQTSVEFAKKQIDSFSIIGISEKHDDFKNKIKDWFLNNYGLILNDSFVINKINQTLINYKNKQYLNSDLIAMLNDNDKKNILKNNQMDFEIYNYVKEKINVK